MGLCLADHLIEQKKLDACQLMWAFLDWDEHGYNTPFTVGEPRAAVGIGNTIEKSFKEFKSLDLSRQAAGHFQTTQGNAFSNSNGSLMRLGPVALIAKSEEEAMALAAFQSKITHRGEEAQECCKAMAFFLFHALHSPQIDPLLKKEEVFAKLSSSGHFIPSVTGLVQSQTRVKNPETGSVENWNWKEPDFVFAARHQECMGSYAMDALAMALHCLYTTSTFKDAVLKAATRGGDADTIGAIAGQLAGAIYGVDAIPKEWIAHIHQWDRGGEIAARGHLLCQY